VNIEGATWRMIERAERIARLVEKPRCLTVTAASTVVDAAMFGIGCLEGRMRQKIQEGIDAQNQNR
jgi:hypothetical protein